MDDEDCCIKCLASEYIEIPSVIYKKKIIYEKIKGKAYPSSWWQNIRGS